MIKFRNPKREEVGIVATSVSEYGCEFIPYIKGYAIAQILDDAVGITGWEKNTEIVTRTGEGSFMKTTLSIFDEFTGRWISKDGVGEPGNISGDKTQETDSLKRAALSWGIGRQFRAMADRQRLFISSGNLDMEAMQGFDGAVVWRIRNNFVVSDLEYDEDDNVKLLTVSDDKGKVLFSYGISPVSPVETSNETEKPEKKEKQVKASIKKPKEDPAVTEAKKVEIDVGGKNLMGKKLKDASPQQMLWIFRHTNSPSVKNALMTIAQNSSEVKEIFVADGIRV